ncbi:MAG: YsnF/AvaK domain-containing protein [Candidatus Nitrosocosmicus sp.]
MSPNNNKNNIDWDSVVKKEAIGIDGLDLGEVHEVGDTYLITQKGLINKKRYHIPKSSAESFDGDTLKLRISESEIQGFEETEDQKFQGYSSFKSSDMSKELETKIPVMAENLEVTKHVLEDKVDIVKEPVMETKTVEIELTRETITIERRSVDNSDPSSYESTTESGPVETRTEISIPLKREEPVITKKPYVKEEVIVKKKPITETKTVSEDITREEIKYDDNKSSLTTDKNK